MRVLVYEPHYEGHRLHYVATVLPALAEVGADVTVALGAVAPGRPEFDRHLRPWADGTAPGAARVRFDPWMPDAPAGPAASARAQVGWLRESIRRARPDHLLVPGADGLSQMLGLRRVPGAGRLLLGPAAVPAGVESEAMLLRGGFAYPQPGRTGRLKAELSWASAARAPWTTLHHLDPLVVAAVRRRGGRLGKTLRLMPEPVEPPSGAPREQVLASLGLPTGGRYIGLAGLMDARKGIDRLLRAFAAACAAGALRADDRLLLAGPHDPAIRDGLAGEFADLCRAGRVQSIDRVLGSQEMADLLGAMDVVATPYPRHVGSASIVVRAAAAGRPVLGSTFGWIGHVVPRFGLGQTVNVEDPAAFARAIPAALDESAAFQLGEAGRRFIAYHTADNFRAHWARRLRERLGLPAAAGHREWDWVLEVTDER